MASTGTSAATGAALDRRLGFGCRRGDLDVARLGHRRGRGRGPGPQRGEVGLERAHHPLAVLGLEARQRLDVGEQRVAPARQLEDLLFEAAALGFALAARLGLGVGDQAARRHLGLVEHLARLGGRLGDRFVGGALREQQRAVQDVLGLAGAARLALRRRQPVLQLRHALVRRLDRGRRPLEQVVDLVAAVAANLGVNLDVAELSRCDLHVRSS